MKKRQSAALERRKFFADPVLVATIALLIVLLTLFILYPLAMLLLDSIYVRNTNLIPLETVLSGKAELSVKEKNGETLVRLVNNKGKAADVSMEDLSTAYGFLFAQNGRVLKEGDEIDPASAYVKVQDNHVTFDAFPRIFKDYTFNRAFYNTLLLGMITSFGAVVIGLLFAYVDCYVDVRSRVVRKMFGVVSTLPVVSPPFVLSLSMILLFGRGGLITRQILGIYDSNVYGLWGIAIVQILTFFPVCYMMLKGLLKNIDPSMEEAARNMGAGRMKVFTTVTLPLMLPGLGNAFLVTFIESV
ncbi:MAG: ABC transporter permease, partial [Aristaeellaceae bacterium]